MLDEAEDDDLDDEDDDDDTDVDVDSSNNFLNDDIVSQESRSHYRLLDNSQQSHESSTDESLTDDGKRVSDDDDDICVHLSQVSLKNDENTCTKMSDSSDNDTDSSIDLFPKRVPRITEDTDNDEDINEIVNPILSEDHITPTVFNNTILPTEVPNVQNKTVHKESMLTDSTLLPNVTVIDTVKTNQHSHLQNVIPGKGVPEIVRVAGSQQSHESLTDDAKRVSDVDGDICVQLSQVSLQSDDDTCTEMCDSSHKDSDSSIDLFATSVQRITENSDNDEDINEIVNRILSEDHIVPTVFNNTILPTEVPNVQNKTVHKESMLTDSTLLPNVTVIDTVKTNQHSHLQNVIPGKGVPEIVPTLYRGKESEYQEEDVPDTVQGEAFLPDTVPTVYQQEVSDMSVDIQLADKRDYEGVPKKIKKVGRPKKKLKGFQNKKPKKETEEITPNVNVTDKTVTNHDDGMGHNTMSDADTSLLNIKSTTEQYLYRDEILSLIHI